MASTLWVVDSSFKRTQIKVTPGKYLREVLEEACTSRKLDPESYTLKTQTNKVLDLSQPFRLSGLSAGAKLQLTQASRTPSVVSLALQLPESEGGGRLSDKFPSTTSIWLCLRKFEDGVAGTSTRKLNLTQRGVPSGTAGSGRLLYEQPCINVMGRSLETFADLQKTLAQIGLNSGTALLRMTFRKTDQPLEEAMEEIEQHFAKTSLGDSSTAATSGAHAAPDGQAMSVPNAGAENAGMPLEGDAGKEPNEDIPASDGPTAATVENDVIASSSITQPQPNIKSELFPEPSIKSEPEAEPMDGITFYKAPSSSTPAAASRPDDPAEFEPTVDHAKAHQAALGRAGRNTRLLSDKELEEAEQQKRQKLAGIKTAIIRIRYPDQTLAERVIDTSDTGDSLYEKVRTTLRNQEAFELRFMNDKGQHTTVPNDSSKRLIRDLGMQGNILITMAWSPEASLVARQGPSVKDDLLKRAKELKVEVPAQQDAGENAQPTAAPPTVEEKKSGQNRGNIEGKLKKLVGFGRK